MTNKTDSSKSDSERPLSKETGKNGTELPVENFRPYHPDLLHSPTLNPDLFNLKPVNFLNSDLMREANERARQDMLTKLLPNLGRNMLADLDRSMLDEILRKEQEKREQEERRYRIIYCNRCSKSLVGKYYTMKKPDGKTAELCPICLRVVRLRLRILNSKPNYEAKKLIKEALKDLKRAAKYDPEDQQVQANISSVKSILAMTNGSLFGNMFFFLLNKWVLLSVAALLVAVGWLQALT